MTIDEPTISADQLFASLLAPAPAFFAHRIVGRYSIGAERAFALTVAVPVAAAEPVITDADLDDDHYPARLAGAIA